MKENHHEVQLPDYLLVNPGLKTDPVKKQGEIGFIVAAIVNTDEFYVGFADHEVGFYSADALLTLKKSGQIYDLMDESALHLSVNDFKDLKNIALFQEYGSADGQRYALEIVQKNPGLIPVALVTLEEILGLNQTPKRGRSN